REAETNRRAKCRKRRKRIAIDSQILQAMPLAGAQADAWIARQAIEILKKFDLLPKGDARGWIVERRSREADRRKEAVSIKALHTHFVAKRAETNGGDNDIVIGAAEGAGCFLSIAKTLSRRQRASLGPAHFLILPWTATTLRLVGGRSFCGVETDLAQIATFAEFALTRRKSALVPDFDAIGAAVLRQAVETKIAEGVGHGFRQAGFRPIKGDLRPSDAFDQSVDD